MKSYAVISFVLLALTQFTWASPACSGNSCSRDVNLGSCICTLELMPVCGSDGKTYPNRCVLDCHQKVDSQLEFRGTGECQTQPAAETMCLCTMDYRPVCGSDGITYPNECAFNCKKGNLKIVQRSECPHKEKRQVSNSCICTRNINYVCGTDGNTYNNPCLLNCAAETKRNLAISHSGQCDNRVKVVESNNEQVHVVENNPQFNPTCVCNKNMKPVCGSDGNTYNNECQLRCKQQSTRNLQLAYNGPCSSRGSNNNDQVQVVDVNPQYRPGCGPCTKNLKRVCGSDGRTYSNSCVMRCTSLDPSVTVARAGPC